MRSAVLVLLVAAALPLLAHAATESTVRLADKSVYNITRRDASARYRELAPVLASADASRAAVCKPATRCKNVDGTTKWRTKTYLELKPYETLSLVRAARRGYRSAIAILGRLSAFSMTASTLTLHGGKLESRDRSTWFSLTNSALGFGGSQLLGRFRSFALTKSSLGFDKCQVDLLDTVVSVKPGSKLVIRDTGFFVNGTTAASSPFSVAGSVVQVTRGILLFKNIPDAVIINSAVSIADLQLVLINSRLTVIGGTFNSTNSAARLSNSTLTFSRVRFTGDRHLKASFGFRGVPTAFPRPFKDTTKLDFAVAGRGNVTLRSTTTP